MKNRKLEIHESVIIGPQTSIGYSGFRFDRDPKTKKLIQLEHKFGVILHKDVWVGSHVTIARGRWRDTVIGEGTKIDDHAHIAHNVVIGNNCIIAAGATILGSVIIGDNCNIWSNSVIKNGITIGDNCTVSANDFVTKNLPDNSIHIKDFIKTFEPEKQEGEGSKNNKSLNNKCADKTDW